MSDKRSVSAVLFVHDLARVASFYREVLAAKVLSRGADHEILDCGGFHLVVHQIPSTRAESIRMSTPPERRERTAIRLNFVVEDLQRARAEARRWGGQIDDRPPPWAGGDTHIHLGYDPEGNVIGFVTVNS